MVALVALLALSGCTADGFTRLTPAEPESRGSGELAAELLGTVRERGTQATESASARIGGTDHAAVLITDGDRHGMIEIRRGALGQGDPGCTRPRPCRTAKVNDKDVVIVETPGSVTIEVYWPDKALNGSLTAATSTSRFWSGGPPLARVPLDPFDAAALAADLTRY